MSIHEHLPPQARKDLKEVGWTKGLEQAKVAPADGQHFDCATWLNRAREMPKEQFKREVEKELTGRETEPHELMYFKVYKSQVPVIEQALETAALNVGHRHIAWILPQDDLRGLPGGGKFGEREPSNPIAVRGKVLPVPARPGPPYVFRTGRRQRLMKQVQARVRLPRDAYEAFRLQVLARDGWRCQACGRCNNLEVHHKEFRSRQGADTEENLITLCHSCHSATHGS